VLPSSRYYANWLAVIRIFTGIFWLVHGVPKFLNGDRFLPPSGFIVDMVNHSLQGNTGFYHAFLAGVVQPNIMLFAQLTRAGEVLVGISLLLGLFTRLGGAGGIFLALNYMGAQGEFASINTLGSLDIAALVLSAISLIFPTGRVFGLDAVITKNRKIAEMPPLDREDISSATRS
jgi:uncharacterized membrane protein YphA (DoxX/SURF4 family)